MSLSTRELNAIVQPLISAIDAAIAPGMLKSNDDAIDVIDHLTLALEERRDALEEEEDD
jgi:hypothetical protein